MKKKEVFIHDNFILGNKYAEELYHNYASKMPIIDYHNHLSPKQIAEDKIFNNLSECWINEDHYKWRAMRTLGVSENFITGGASDLEKFKKWGYTVPYTMRNPLYHWTHLELKRYFDIDDLLCESNAEEIFNVTSEKLQSSTYSCQNLLKKTNVEVVCTTDDPIDSLEHHKSLLNKKESTTKMLPAFRPDRVILIDAEGYNSYMDKLAVVSNLIIDSYDSLCCALRQRVTYFNENGCKLSDHGLTVMPVEEYKPSEVQNIFKKKRTGGIISKKEELKFQSAIVMYLAELYHEFGWVQQYHLGVFRNNNARMFQLLGPDTGWDSIGDQRQAQNLSTFLSNLDKNNKLTKTIVYNLNPVHNEVMASMIGNFNDGSVKGKVQYGSAWWFLDQKDGMTKQLNALSNMSLLSCFIGMLTDSRSFLSFPRHEYFRRILCNLLGNEIERGELPNDMDWIGKLVEDVSYNNAKEYFNF